MDETTKVTWKLIAKRRFDRVVRLVAVTGGREGAVDGAHAAYRVLINGSLRHTIRAEPSNNFCCSIEFDALVLPTGTLVEVRGEKIGGGPMSAEIIFE